MSKLFKPMLACSESAHHFLDKLRFPLLASPKIDGIRATVRDGIVYARSNKPFPNVNVQSLFANYEYFDGEFVLGSPTRHDLCRATGGVTNSKEKPADDLRLFVFDHVENLEDDFGSRWRKVHEQLPNRVVRHEQRLINDLAQLLAYEEARLEEGYEGLILRDPGCTYKCGRSTANEQALLKLKRFTDAEFEVIGFEERMHNGNEATTNELGRTKRSSHQAGKSGRGDLGAIILQGDGFTFRCGSGWDDAERAEIWSNQDDFKGRLAKIKFFAIGMKDKPRHPVFLSWRDRIDL